MLSSAFRAARVASSARVADTLLRGPALAHRERLRCLVNAHVGATRAIDERVIQTCLVRCDLSASEASPLTAEVGAGVVGRVRAIVAYGDFDDGE
jgi:hypothetical protein